MELRRQLIGNVHAYRVTDSARLIVADDPVGPENDGSLTVMAKKADIVVLAYGQPPKPLRVRANHVVSMLRDEGVRLTYLRLSKDGTPQHPLYLPGSLVPLDGMQLYDLSTTQNRYPLVVGAENLGLM